MLLLCLRFLFGACLTVLGNHRVGILPWWGGAGTQGEQVLWSPWFRLGEDGQVITKGVPGAR